MTPIPPTATRALTQATPTVMLHRSIRRTALVALPLVVLAGVWALRPIDHAPIKVEFPAVAKAPPKTARAAVDADAFAAALWVPPPVVAQAATSPPAPPPAPLKLQLIGIMKETPTGAQAGTPTVLRAALYDPDTDTLHIVAAGERVGAGRFTVSKLTPDTVELADGQERRTISLRPDTKPASP